MKFVIKDRASGSAVKVTVEEIADNSGTSRSPMLSQILEDMFDPNTGLSFWWDNVKDIEIIRDDVEVPNDERDPDDPNNLA